MKIFKDDSPFAKKVQKVEDLMQELGLQFIPHPYDGMHIHDTQLNITASIKSVDGMSCGGSLPRSLDGEKLILETDDA